MELTESQFPKRPFALQQIKYGGCLADAVVGRNSLNGLSLFNDGWYVSCADSGLRRNSLNGLSLFNNQGETPIMPRLDEVAIP